MYSPGLRSYSEYQDQLRSPIEPQELTQYQRQLQPIYQREMQREEEERSRLKPLQWIFDRLQTGQYVSANVANSIIEAIQGKPEDERQTLVEAVTTGLTGKVKGSYEDIIRDTLGLGEGKVFGRAPEGTRRAQMDWADVLGFVGDVLLDPLTYMSFGGATGGAKMAAGQFADDSVRLYLRQLAQNTDELARLTKGKIAPQQVSGLLSDGTEKAMRELSAKSGDLGRIIDRTYREAYQAGLRKTQQELMQRTGSALREIGEPEGGLAQIGLEDIATRLQEGVAYQGAGETFAARFMTKEMGVGPEKGLTKVRRNAWGKFENFFKQSRVGSKVSDGIWGVMNVGPIGEIRRTLGFRNPYQKYLRAKELDALQKGRVAEAQAVQDLLQPVRDLSDEQLDLLYKNAARLEDMVENVVTEGASFSGGSAADRILGLTKTGDSQVDEAMETLFGENGVLRRMKGEEDFWSTRLNEDIAEVRQFYLPKIQRARRRGINVSRQRQYTMNQSFQREVELTKFIYGVDEDIARELVESNVTALGTDLREALIERGMIHGRAKGRWALFEQIKEMGIDLRDNLDPAAASLKTAGREFDDIGLSTVDHPALKDFVFDREVAKIAENAIQASGRGKNIFQRMMKSYANWWKGIVLLTTGYHARNFMTNTMIQFLHHGPKAFNKDDIMRSASAVWYTLKRSDPNVDLSKFLQEVGLNENRLSKYLNQRVGNMTVRDLADQAWDRNVISQSTMGYDRRSILEQFQGKSQQPLRTASRTLGAYVENIPRFQSFMLDYIDNATADISKLNPGNLLDVEKPALDYAALEAKKYFLDYEDLTSFERDTLKNIIPFYTFLRKNLAAQIEALSVYPEMYSLLPKIEEFVTYEDPDYDPSMVPEWMRQEGMFPIRRADAELGIVGKALEAIGVDMAPGEGLRFFRPDFAFNDLNLIPLEWEEGDWMPHLAPDELKDTLINATAPWIRRIADLMMDSDNAYNFFYKENMGDTTEAPYLMRLFASRPEVVPFIDGLLRFAGFPDGAKINVRDNKLEIDSNMALILEEALPVLRQGAYLFYLVDDLPWLNNVLEKTFNVEDEYEGVEEVLQNLSFWLGVKMRDQDLEREKQIVARDIYYRSRDILNEQRRNLPGAERRSLEYQQRTDSLIRRLR